MKTLLLLAFVLFGAQSYANIADQSWDSLIAKDASYRLDIRWPRVTAGVQIKDICVAGEGFQTRGPLTLCTEWKAIHTKNGRENTSVEWVCLAKETKVWDLSRNYSEKRCTKFSRPEGRESGIQCVEEKVFNFTYPTEFAVEIYSTVRGSDRDLQLLGVKKYTVPSCN